MMMILWWWSSSNCRCWAAIGIRIQVAKKEALMLVHDHWYKTITCHHPMIMIIIIIIIHVILVHLYTISMVISAVRGPTLWGPIWQELFKPKWFDCLTDFAAGERRQGVSAIIFHLPKCPSHWYFPLCHPQLHLWWPALILLLNHPIPPVAK